MSLSKVPRLSRTATRDGKMEPNQTLEQNRRPAFALNEGGEHGRAAHYPACL